MALQKEITLDNGVTVNYHRIVSLNQIINNATIIEVASYTDISKRQEEKEYYENTDENKSMNVFIETHYYNQAYNENETIDDAYKYLKTLDEYKNAGDI